jgi:hypothetical protein
MDPNSRDLSRECEWVCSNAFSPRAQYYKTRLGKDMLVFRISGRVPESTIILQKLRDAEGVVQPNVRAMESHSFYS